MNAEIVEEYRTAVLEILNSDLPSLEDLLSPEQKAQLQSDLSEMARKRRQAYDSARDWPMA